MQKRHSSEVVSTENELSYRRITINGAAEDEDNDYIKCAELIARCLLARETCKHPKRSDTSNEKTNDSIMETKKIESAAVVNETKTKEKMQEEQKVDLHERNDCSTHTQSNTTNKQVTPAMLDISALSLAKESALPANVCQTLEEQEMESHEIGNPSQLLHFDQGLFSVEDFHVDTVSWEEYVKYIQLLYSAIENGPCLSVARMRLTALTEKFRLHKLLNSELEQHELIEEIRAKQRMGQLFSMSVDNARYVQTAMAAPTLLQFIVKMCREEPELLLFVDHFDANRVKNGNNKYTDKSNFMYNDNGNINSNNNNNTQSMTNMNATSYTGNNKTHFVNCPVTLMEYLAILSKRKGIGPREAGSGVEEYARQISVEGLGLHPSLQRHYTGAYNALDEKKNPAGANVTRLLQCFLSSSGPLHGDLLGALLRAELERNEYDYLSLTSPENNTRLTVTNTEATEIMLPLYGIHPNELHQLAEWIGRQGFNQFTLNKWILYVDRCVDWSSTQIQSFTQLPPSCTTFAEQLRNIFYPLFMATMCPTHKDWRAVAGLLEKTSALCINPLPTPRKVNFTSTITDPQSVRLSADHTNCSDYYFIYYIWCNVHVLNELRRQRGKNVIQLRLAITENAPAYDQLICGFLCADIVYHVASLHKCWIMQYLYTLSRIGVVMSLLRDNTLGMNYLEHIFVQYFQHGMCVSLATFDPLYYSHRPLHKLEEEYTTLMKVHNLTRADMDEIRQNGILLSGFDEYDKSDWLSDFAFLVNNSTNNCYGDDDDNDDNNNNNMRRNQFTNNKQANKLCDVLDAQCQRERCRSQFRIESYIHELFVLNVILGKVAKTKETALKVEIPLTTYWPSSFYCYQFGNDHGMQLIGERQLQGTNQLQCTSQQQQHQESMNGESAAAAAMLESEWMQSEEALSSTMRLSRSKQATKYYKYIDYRINYPRVLIDEKAAYSRGEIMHNVKKHQPTQYNEHEDDDSEVDEDEDDTRNGNASKMSYVVEMLRHGLILRHKYLHFENADVKVEDVFSADNSFNESVWEYNNFYGVLLVSRWGTKPEWPSFLPTIEQFIYDVQAIKNMVGCPALHHFAQHRLQLLESKFLLHRALNIVNEAGKKNEKAWNNRDFFTAYKVDTNIHTEAGCNTKTLLEFFMDKAMHHGNDVVFEEEMCEEEEEELLEYDVPKEEIGFQNSKVMVIENKLVPPSSSSLLSFATGKDGKNVDTLRSAANRQKTSIDVIANNNNVCDLNSYNKPKINAMKEKEQQQQQQEESQQYSHTRPVTLQELLHRYHIDAARITVDELHYQLRSHDDLRHVFLSPHNYMKGRYFAELIKNTFAIYQEDTYSFAENRLKLMGYHEQEWYDLAHWFDRYGMSSAQNRWMVSFPCNYSYLRRIHAVNDFGDYLDHLFAPLWEISLHPARDAKFHYFLAHISGFDCYLYYTKKGVLQNPAWQRNLQAPLCPTYPHDWNTDAEPPYSYYLYYFWANIISLNQFRASRGLSTFSFRPHCGERTAIGANVRSHVNDKHTGEELIAGFLLANGINHGIALVSFPVLQYMYYLAQICIAMSPLSNTANAIQYLRNPFPIFFNRGLHVSLATNTPLYFHFTREPLVEEYSIASKLWQLEFNDCCEIARNSVVQSGFPTSWKRNALGPLYHLHSTLGNMVRRSHLSDIRVAFRFETYHEEVNYLDSQLYLSIQCMPRAMMTMEEEFLQYEKIALEYNLPILTHPEVNKAKESQKEENRKESEGQTKINGEDNVLVSRGIADDVARLEEKLFATKLLIAQLKETNVNLASNINAIEARMATSKYGITAALTPNELQKLLANDENSAAGSWSTSPDCNTISSSSSSSSSSSLFIIGDQELRSAHVDTKKSEECNNINVDNHCTEHVDNNENTNTSTDLT